MCRPTGLRSQCTNQSPLQFIITPRLTTRKLNQRRLRNQNTCPPQPEVCHSYGDSINTAKDPNNLRILLHNPNSITYSKSGEDFAYVCMSVSPNSRLTLQACQRLNTTGIPQRSLQNSDKLAAISTALPRSQCLGIRSLSRQRYHLSKQAAR
jgi:hypothetical protein